MKFDPEPSYMDFSSCLFFHGGVVANYAITPIHLAQIEFYYDPKGCNAEESGLGYKYEYRLNYISIPLLYRIQPFPSFGAYGTSGFQFSFLTSAKESWEGSEMDVKDNYKTTDLGWVIGVGADLPYRISVDIRYILGLMDVYDPDFGDTYQMEDEKRRNNVFQISARIRIIGNH
jgi:hypothetical protein